MLALRLVRGAHPLVTLRRLLVTASAGGVSFLLLSALGHAAAHPDQPARAAVRLLWCLVPLAATVQLAVAVARTETSSRALTGLDAAGLGPSRMPLLAAVSTLLSCLTGSTLALAAFLLLRGQTGGPGTLPLAGSASGLLSGDRPLPPGAVLTLLCVTPFTAAVAAAFTMRPRAARTGRAAGGSSPPPGRTAGPAAAAEPEEAPVLPVPAGLPWGVALVTTGLALEAFAGRDPAGDGGLVPMPGRLGAVPPGVIAGWLVTALGLILAGPGLTHLCGRLLTTGRPGALRLLAGRMLQDDAPRLGRSLGVLCAVSAGALAAAELYGTAPAGGARAFGPLTALGAALVMGCATASALTAAVEARALRAPTTTALIGLGAPRSLPTRAAAVRVAAVVAVLAPVAWLTGEMAALPLRYLMG
ncbi:hypothetical protein [Streptomyces sp. JJ36]|uniref:hypothetical protein n=1 Tax=Streptomyces sp. JJ36 TaxID=2736645 RepID=UPI001F46BB58|nr:hypothetical protein [Streptomyces sp. JJ36]MCF6523259.1 hypothetical protein [Streptomyces sp. JJ36]